MRLRRRLLKQLDAVDKKLIFRLRGQSPKPRDCLHVIDVSSFQGVINWEYLSGVIDAAILRVGFVDAYYGGGFSKVDPQFKQNQLDARAARITIGYYYYGFFDESPITQAQRFITAVGTPKKYETFWLDLEDRHPNATKDWVSAFIKTVEQHTNRRCHIYTDYAWALEHPWINTFLGEDRNIWLAYYRRSRRIDLHGTPVGNIDMHQYSRRGRLPGISTFVDLSRF